MRNLEILKIKNNKIKVLNPTENEYEELINKRNLNKNIKKFSDISNEIKKLISNYNSNDYLNSIEKNLNKLEKLIKNIQIFHKNFLHQF